MGKTSKRVDRRWIILSITITAVLFLYFFLPLLVRGIFSFCAAILFVGAVIRALPQALWWSAVAIFFSIWGLKLLIRFGSGWLPQRRITEAQSPGGPLEFIHSVLTKAGSSVHSQEEIKNLLRSLVLDLIVLKLEISEAEAREKLIQGSWTEDSLLKAFFVKKPDSGKERRGRIPWFRRLRDNDFLDEVRQVLDRLEAYGEFQKGKDVT